MTKGEWERARERALSRLREHVERGLVDKDIVDFLISFNNIYDKVFTTSSCSGRVAVISGLNVFDKRGAVLHSVFHDPEECRSNILQALSNAVKEAAGRIVWISLQPPIIHFASRDEETAHQIVSKAEAAGFNRACYRRYRVGGYHVEVAVSDKLHILNPTPQHAQEACNILAKYKERLRKLISLLLDRGS